MAINWPIEEEDSPAAEMVLESWERQNRRIVAPHFMPFEVASIIYRHVLNESLTLERGTHLIENLLLPQIELIDAVGLHRRAMEWAFRIGQGAAYDSHYLALAEILDCEMWTADGRFYRAASIVESRIRLLGEQVAPGR